MTKYLIALACALLLSACATSIQKPPAAEAGAEARTQLRFQNFALSPANGGQLVTISELRPGDIFLSAAKGITSAGIRIVTLAPVSHASIYIGNQQVVEAVGQGVRLRTLAEVIEEEDVIVAFRHPKAQPEQQEKLRAYALEQVGKKYDHIGIVLQAPFSLERRICELPLMPSTLRDACLQGIAVIQLGAFSNDRFFCSQFVLEAYRQAGLPLTDAHPRWISPADILHMREGDVPSMKIHQTLSYVGHVKFAPQVQIANKE